MLCKATAAGCYAYIQEDYEQRKQSLCPLPAARCPLPAARY